MCRCRALPLHPAWQVLQWGCAIADAEHRSRSIYLDRFNLAGHHDDLLREAGPEAPAAPVGPGGPFVPAWRNYVKSVFKPGFMYRVSIAGDKLLYIASNKTLGGREDRMYEGEAVGRKMAVVFFEDMPGPGHEDLVRRVQRDTQGMDQTLLTIAEVLQSLG